MIKTSFKKMRITLENYLMLSSLVFIILLLTVIGIVLYNSMGEYITEEMNFINKIRLNQISGGLSKKLNQSMKITEYLNNNKQLVKYIDEIENHETTAVRKAFISNKITEFLLGIKESNEFIRSINIVNNSFQYQSNNMLFDYSDIEKFVKTSSNKTSFHKARKEDTNDIRNEYMHFTFNITDNNIFYGTVYIFLNEKIMSDNQNILILDNNDEIVWKGDEFKLEIFENIKNNSLLKPTSDTVYSNEFFKVYYKTMDFNEFKILYMVKTNPLTDKLKSLRNLTLFSFALSFIIAFLLSNVVSKTVTSPLKKLIKIIRNYKSNVDEVSIPKEKKSKLSLKDRIFYYYISTILLPVAFYLIIFYVQSTGIIISQITDGYYAIFESAYINVDEYLGKKITIAQNIGFNEAVQEFMSSENKSVDMNLVSDIIEQNIYLGLGDNSFGIYNDQNTKIISNRNFMKESIEKKFFEELKELKRGVLWDIDKNQDFLSIGIPVMGLQESKNEPIGYINMDIKYIYLNEQCEDLKIATNDILITDRDNSIIYHSKPENITQIADSVYLDSFMNKVVNISGKRQLIFKKNMENLPWSFITVYDYTDLYKQGENIIRTSIIYIIIIVFLSVVLLAYSISLSILKPINKFNDFFEKIGLRGIGIEKIENNSFINEISMLNITFNKMIERIDELIDEVIISNVKKSKLENEKKDAEIIALQAQINPHFLYNTLDTINHMVKGNDDAVVMITALSDLFRYGISKGGRLIDIKEELNYAKAYTEIMKIRYSNEIEFKWDYMDNVLEYKTIKLILQPIIENSIYHGFRNKSKQKGVIWIICKEESNCIKFIVTDNGIGIEPKELEKIQEYLDSNQNKNKVGIYNINSRLKLHYGNEYKIDITSTYMTGTTVSINIPKV